MSSHYSLLQAMRRAVKNVGIDEVPAAGEFSLSAGKTQLFPAAVYGFAARLSDAERLSLLEEARARGLCRLSNVEAFKPIEGDLYPIYWGKDKQLGARPHQHLGDPVGTGAIRLSTYTALAGRPIACVSLTVTDFDGAEQELQRVYPDLLKTTTKKFRA